MCGRFSGLTALVFLCAFLAACGGGGGGGAPLDVGDPVPLPPPPTNDSLADLTVDETFEALSVVMKFDVDGAGTASNISSNLVDQSGNATVSYDVGDDSFAISVNQGGISFADTFAPADIDPGQSDASFTVYSKNSDDRVLILLNPQDPELDFTYGTFGNWLDVDQAGNSLSQGYVIFGVRTPAADVPSTGTATYEGETVGSLVDAAGTIYTVTGTAQLTADFAAGTLDGDFGDAAKIDVLTDIVSPWRNFTISTTINGNTFDGTAQTDDGVLSGTAAGGFFGPGAEEAGGVWRMIGSGEEAIGAFGGKQ